MIQDSYEHMDEIEIDIRPTLDDHHIENVVAYLAEQCRAITPEQTANKNIDAYREAAKLLEAAATILGSADYHRFHNLYNA